MNITRDVIIDLLPVYESGEASADTRAIVDDFLARDEEFARIVRAARQQSNRKPVVPSPAETEGERMAVNRTFKALRRKNLTLFWAIFCTMVPFTFGWSGSSVTFFMLRDQPASGALLFFAAGLWWSYFRQSQAFRKAGWEA